MGRKMDALLGRGFRGYKFKIVAKLAVSRLAILKNQRRARSSTARSDVIELLNLGHQDRALLRVEQVIKEQNMLDVFGMMEDFILLLTERLALLQDNNNKECPEELQEAISSLIFAATRCGEFPELNHIRHTFTSRFGKDFAARATELRNNCKVNSKMIQKLSTRSSTLENRLQMLKQIAAENNISLQLEEPASAMKRTVKHDLASGDNETNSLAEKLSESIKASKFEGAAEAAQEAFEAAIYAAAAARAAVQLSRTHSPHINDVHEPKKNSPTNSSSSSSEAESSISSIVLTKRLSLHKQELERTLSVSSTDTEMAPNQSEQCTDIVVYESYNEATETEKGNKDSDEDHSMERKLRSFSDLGQKLYTQHSGIDRKLLSVRRTIRG